jgi:hypothetical protein
MQTRTRPAPPDGLPRQRVLCFALAMVLSWAALAQPTASANDKASKLVQEWKSADSVCQSDSADALASIAACEQRDLISKRLAQLSRCVSSHTEGLSRIGALCHETLPSVGGCGPVQLRQLNGVLVIPVGLNGTLQEMAVLDSGASTVQVPEALVAELQRRGALLQKDRVAVRQHIMADGRGLQQQTFRLRSVQIGMRRLDNVLASTGAAKAKLLLGQSALHRLTEWSVDNASNTFSCR